MRWSLPSSVPTRPRRTPIARAVTDAAIDDADFSVIIPELEAARAAPAGLGAVIVHYSEVEEIVEMELSRTLDELTNSPRAGRAGLVEATTVLRSAIELRADLTEVFNGYFGVQFPFRSSSSQLVFGDLVSTRAAFADGVAHLRDLETRFPALADAIDTIETDESLSGFMEVVDAAHRAVPHRRCPGRHHRDLDRSAAR